jgi:hypothetical protein
MDPDPGGPKTCGSGGSGSATLHTTILVLCKTCVVCREVVGLTACSQLLVQAGPGGEHPTVLGVKLSGPILSEPSRTVGAGRKVS